MRNSIQNNIIVLVSYKQNINKMGYRRVYQVYKLILHTTTKWTLDLLYFAKSTDTGILDSFKGIIFSVNMTRYCSKRKMKSVKSFAKNIFMLVR